MASISISPSADPGSRATRWLSAPANSVLTLIVLSAAARAAFAAMTGLGIDESYMVAAGRNPQLSYFDHPPLSWWLAWAAAHLAGSESSIVVRAPFIVLFGLSTWLMYRLGEILFSAPAGLWAAVLLNLAPLFGVTTASWVLPDGPLDCALVGLMLCSARALSSERWRWWIGAGACAGLALLSKYTAVLSILGFALYLLTQPGDRRWLLRPQPYVAGVITAVLFSPVLIWNAQHQWISFIFQGGRSAGVGFHPIALLTSLGGEALFLAPWIWLPLMASTLKAFRGGPRRRGDWLLFCVGATPIAVFSLIALFSTRHVLFHWAAPGYLVLFPLLGADAASRLAAGDRFTRGWLIASVIVLVAALFLVASEIRWNWLPNVGERFAPGKDPALEAVDWTSLKPQLARRQLLDPNVAAVAAIRWHDAGKLDYALGGSPPVICLGADPREYGLIRAAASYRGRDVLIVAPGATMAGLETGYGSMFSSIEALPPLVLIHAGHRALVVPLFVGQNLRGSLRVY